MTTATGLMVVEDHVVCNKKGFWHSDFANGSAGTRAEQRTTSTLFHKHSYTIEHNSRLWETAENCTQSQKWKAKGATRHQSREKKGPLMHGCIFVLIWIMLYALVIVHYLLFVFHKAALKHVFICQHYVDNCKYSNFPIFTLLIFISLFLFNYYNFPFLCTTFLLLSLCKCPQCGNCWYPLLACKNSTSILLCGAPPGDCTDVTNPDFRRGKLPSWQSVSHSFSPSLLTPPRHFDGFQSVLMFIWPLWPSTHRL